MSSEGIFSVILLSNRRMPGAGRTRIGRLVDARPLQEWCPG